MTKKTAKFNHLSDKVAAACTGLAESMPSMYLKPPPLIMNISFHYDLFQGLAWQTYSERPHSGNVLVGLTVTPIAQHHWALF